MAIVYPDIRIMEEVHIYNNVVWNINIFIVPVVCPSRNVRHSSSDAMKKDS